MLTGIWSYLSVIAIGPLSGTFCVIVGNVNKCQNIVCDKPVAKDRTRYCSATCLRNMNQRSYRMRKKLAKVGDRELVLQNTRRGQTYRSAIRLGLDKAIMERTVTDEEIAHILGCSPAAVSTVRASLMVDNELAGRADDYIPSEAEPLLEDFATFRNEFFRDNNNKPYVTMPFHQKWIDSILKAMEEGGRQMILSPPRHGKTDLLTHFAVWMIVKRPNIRILWVGGNEDIAKRSVSAVMDHLENNEKLIQTFLPPGLTFRPVSRSGKSWSQSEFTVETRTVTGIRSATMRAVGRSGRILSRDADLIVADDIEDFQSVAQPSGREATRYWFTTTLSSRKEEHTAMILIGSRQHREDLYGALLESDEWNHIIESAHDPLCEKNEDIDKLHVDCVLWPEKRTYRWLNQQRRSSMVAGGLELYQMVYLNRPPTSGATIFDKEAVLASRNFERIAGERPKGTRGLIYVGGLDPAVTGYQAAWLWAFDIEQKRQYCIDVDNHKGGGVLEAERVIKEWYEKYQLKHWVIEENNFWKGLRQDRVLTEWTNRNGIRIEGHETHNNKWDPEYGVTAMGRLFTDGRIELPYGDASTKAKIDVAIKQFILFGTDYSQSRKKFLSKSDLVMASWFPQKTYAQLTKRAMAENIKMEYDPSYGDYSSIELGGVPW